MVIFPNNPTVGQLYVADNTVTYEWTGDRWSAHAAMVSGQSSPVFDGLYAISVYNTVTDVLLDGGTA